MACLPACNYCACYGFIRHPYRFVGRKNSATHIGIAGANAINRRSFCFRLNSASDCQKRLQFHRLDAFESSSFLSCNAANHSDPSEVEEDFVATTSEVEEDGVRTTKSSAPPPSSDSSDPVVQTGTWNWGDYRVRYQFSGNGGPALVLIHGFGANSDHWRNNLPYLARSHRVYSIDLLGYGYSDKPNPKLNGNPLYTFDTWATQVNDFCAEVVKGQAFFICNSIGGIIGLQAALMKPALCRGLVLLNISLRMLHIKKQPWYARPFIRVFQNLLRDTDLGKIFFKSIATPSSVKSILSQCYYDKSKVTDELVEKILLPGLEPGAAEVFLEFICYSDGPLPEELLSQVKCPVLLGWGDKDPWEPIHLGKAYEDFEAVEDFITLPNVGHCPQDEAPELVNPLVESFVANHAKDEEPGNRITR